jgi:hypothetical protein
MVHVRCLAGGFFRTASTSPAGVDQILDGSPIDHPGVVPDVYGVGAKVNGGINDVRACLQGLLELVGAASAVEIAYWKT